MSDRPRPRLPRLDLSKGGPDRPTNGNLGPVPSPWGQRRFPIFLTVWTLIGLVAVGPFVVHLLAEVPRGQVWTSVLAIYAWGLTFPLFWWLDRGRSGERRLAASRLAGQLAEANLQMLKMQLHPHFLFNTLNAISSLMHRDVDAADSMITRLSDLLRLALEEDHRHQVPLTAELRFLESYLAIERIRFRDRLQVDVEVPADCRDAQVPRLVLQPLVENAVKHGIALRSAAGQLAIRARRADGGVAGDRLALVVADDGPGLTPGREPRLGVGLSNTRARLAQIYGDDFLFELVNVEPGGLEARIEIPFETRSRTEPVL